MDKKYIAVMVAIAVVFGAGGFFGGLKYQKSKTPQRAQAFRAGQGGPGGNFAGRGGAGQGGFTVGEIISKDDKSITVKMQDGSSKIVFLAGSSQIVKSTSGTVDDLAVGTNVMVTGSANSDGSLTAQNVQIRPAAPQRTNP
jgi:hypothetical protein